MRGGVGADGERGGNCASPPAIPTAALSRLGSLSPIACPAVVSRLPPCSRFAALRATSPPPGSCCLSHWPRALRLSRTPEDRARRSPSPIPPRRDCASDGGQIVRRSLGEGGSPALGREVACAGRCPGAGGEGRAEERLRGCSPHRRGGSIARRQRAGQFSGLAKEPTIKEGATSRPGNTTGRWRSRPAPLAASSSSPGKPGSGISSSGTSRWSRSLTRSSRLYARRRS